MDSRIICSVMLYSYNGLESKCELIDKDLFNTAVRSAFRNTMEAVAEIEQLTAEKIACINTKVVIDQALSSLKRAYELEQHDIKGLTAEQIATALNEKEGTIKARISYQRIKLYEAIQDRYSGEELLNIICDSKWLMSRYRRELKHATKNEPKTDDK